METSTKQKILTILIVIAVILLILIGVYVFYQEENIKTDNKVEKKEEGAKISAQNDEELNEGLKEKPVEIKMSQKKE